MTTQLCDPEELEQWWPAGSLPRWVTAAVAAATITTLAVSFAGTGQLAAFCDVDAFWLRDGLGLVFAAIAVAIWLPRWRLARAIRAAVVLPIAQVVAIAVVWRIWCAWSPHVGEALLASPLARWLPLELVVGAAAGATALIARAIAGRRRRDWLRATVMLAIVHLLLAGLWLPFTANLWCRGADARWWTWHDLYRVLAQPQLIANALVPPLAAATAFTWFTVRHPALARTVRGPIVVLALALFAVAIDARLEPNLNSVIFYCNFVHVLLALTIVAGAALGAFGVLTWLHARRSARELASTALRGTIAHDGGGAVAGLEIAGWWSGPRTTSRPFTVISRDGLIAVPGDVAVLANAPAQSSRLASGQAVAILREGDSVALAGFIVPPADHPFRTLATPIAGPGSVVVAREPIERAGFAAIALAMWRPCVAYLLVVAAIALPGLAAAFSER